MSFLEQHPGTPIRDDDVEEPSDDGESLYSDDEDDGEDAIDRDATKRKLESNTEFT